MKNQKIIFAFLSLLALSACKKDKKTEEPLVETPDTSKDEILADISSKVVYATYSDMDTKATVLYNQLVEFKNNTTPANLTIVQQSWRDVRSAWEQSEGFLFGPVSSENIDPRIDTWPIDFARIDSVLSGNATLTPDFVNNLEESLKGFHPIEYLLWGSNGNKTTSDFTNREKEFLVALGDNLKTLCTQVKNAWNPALPDNYTQQFNTAGSGSKKYLTQRAAYEEMIDAMTGICEEVANGKIGEPYTQQNARLEESPFAKNSIADFTNNIKSVQNIYLGKYLNDGKGLEDLIKANNLSMDGQIKTKISNAIIALSNITVPFGQAISSQKTQVQNAINTITDVKEYLEKDVKPFVKTLVN